MLAALEESTRAQRQLVADASHELRTPLTSLRTNVEVLRAAGASAGGAQSGCSRDVVEQLDEMTTLIAELIELAAGRSEPGGGRGRPTRPARGGRGRARAAQPARCQLSRRVSTSRVVHGVPATHRARRRQTCSTTPPSGARRTARSRSASRTARSSSAITGRASTTRTSPTSSTASTGRASARGMPGSGLGLAIVRQVAESHGGQVVAERAEGGGTRVTLRLNGRPSS